ncbi:afadin [Asbolus verrucosus]|uniref:Afadin n=1 Tax=Asbolus verrucosus TaxID=1661398 RepID=A0A482V7H2_ASBVE|nr:afadin [Asbolus verrucosus]
MDRYPRGQDPILPAVLEFPEEPQEQFLARVITHLDVTTPTFRLAPAYTLYLCARYRASTHYRPELTPTERAHKLTVLLQHAAMLIRHTVQDRSTESTSQAFWLANASELLHFLKSDRHVSAFSLQAQDTLADAVQLAFKNLVACLTDELNSAMTHLMSVGGDDHPREVINILSSAMNLLRKCRVNAALTIQLFSQLFHWISAKALANVISNSNLCTRSFGNKLFNRLRNLQAWAESQGLELAAECHLAKIVQCAHLMQAPKYTPEELANLSSACFKLNSMQLGALLRQYKAEPGEKLAPPPLLEQAAKAAESVADELARAEGREVTLYEDPAPPLQLLLPDDGFSCDVVQGVPPGLADFLHPLQASGLCRLAAQPTSSGHWTVYMSAPRPPSALSTTQPEVQVIRLHKAGGGMGLSIVAAKGAGQERLGIYIKSVVPGGAADRDGRLAAGDQLLSVDGQSLLGITQEKAAEFLVRTGSVVTLEVAKGGAVYHGLATLLQQPSPTPHRAVDFYGDSYSGLQSSQESLYSLNNGRLFTPPATKPKNNVFFNSDDTLYKRESRKFTIPRIEIDCEPTFNLQVTDFSEPSPRSIVLGYDESGTDFEAKKVEEVDAEPRIGNKSWKEKANNFVQQKSYSIDIHENPYVDIEQVSDTDKFLSISAKKFRQQRLFSASLQDLSSSTSSINSGVHESNLDLSHIDPDTPIKHKNWKSPDEVRHGQVEDKSKNFESKATSFPQLNKKKSFGNRSKSVSEEKLDDKLTEYERLEVLKLLRDWSLNGSESKSECSIRFSKSSEHFEKENSEKSEKSMINSNLRKNDVKFNSEPNLSPKTGNKDSLVVIAKYNSENNIRDKKNFEPDLMHKCEFRNCIFNENFVAKNGANEEDFNVANKTSKPKKSILKNSRERLQEIECLNNITNLQKTPKLSPDSRRHSEIIEPQSFNSQLVRCDSLERLTHLQKKSSVYKKFPESYIVTRRNSLIRAQRAKNYNENYNRSPKKSPKIIVLKNKYLPKTWKSCSDIKNRKTVRKCCRYAKKNCPIMKSCSEASRKTQSCADIERDYAARLAALKDNRAFDCPRRMSERDLPSRVDSERTIPSSKSVPALHHISPNSEQPRNPHDVFNPGYSRTSSNNSINTNSAAAGPANGPVNNPGLRSRSTHNLHQQDGGFYQNLSVYRNKIPSPQHLGDRTSALRSSQNSLQSSVVNSQRPASAYYPPPMSVNASRSNLHQSIPNLKSPPSTHRLHGDDSRSGSYPSVNQQHHQTYPGQNYPNYHPRAEESANRSYNSPPYQGQSLKEANSYSSPAHNTLSYPNNVQHVHANGQRQDDNRYNNVGGGLLREDIVRQSQNSRHEEIMRYLSTNNARINEQNRLQEDLNRTNEMRVSKSEDLLKHPQNHQTDMMRYASSGNIRAHESSKVEIPLYRMKDEEELDMRMANNVRPQKLVENAEILNRKKQRIVGPAQQTYYPHQQYYNQHNNSPYSPSYNMQMQQNAQSMQNLTLNQQYSQSYSNYHQQNQYYPQQGNQVSSPTSPTYKSPPIAPKPSKKVEEPPELPPTSTHPLYSASAQDPPKMAFYPTSTVSSSGKTPRDPWAREEQERQAEARREASRQWQEQQIRELMALPHRTPQQDEQLRVLQLEREFQRRAMEAAEQDDEDTEKESPSPNQVATPNASKEAPPTSILKPGAVNNHPQPPPPEPVAPPPPERGSSFAVMSMRTKENTKRVSFDTSAAASQPPVTLQLEETIREDPNSFIRQAESMLASPTTPTDASPGMSTATPGVIGAQEVYRDPRARRLAEQAQQKNQTMPAVPEKLSFKEKMKMFAMETGEQETPKDKSKISRAQREIDNLGSPSSGLVH